MATSPDTARALALLKQMAAEDLAWFLRVFETTKSNVTTLKTERRDELRRCLDDLART